MFKTRTPFIGEIVTVFSPDDPEVEFGIKRVGNRERMIHQDRNATIRYIQNGEGEEGENVKYTTEKDYPVGSMKADTISLCLASWNLADPQGHPIPVTRDAIIDHTTIAEFDFLYKQCVEINPILLGEAAQKKD